MAEFAKYFVYVDWNGDGDFSDANENISAYAIRAWWSRGKDFASAEGKAAAGACQVILNNSDSRFSAFNALSPLHDQLVPGRAVKITMQIGAAAAVTMFQGELFSITPQPGNTLKDATAILQAKGILARLAEPRSTVQIAMQTNITTGAAVEVIAEAAGIGSGARLVDTGQSTMARYWTGGKANVLGALRDIEETEAGYIGESRDGKLIFEDRAHRAASPHDTVQATFSNSESANLRYQEINPEDYLPNIFNLVRAKARAWDISPDMVLWKMPAGITLAPAESVTVWAEYPDPGVDEWTTIVLAATNGYYYFGDIDIDATDKFDTARKIELTNVGSETAYITSLECLGYAVIERDPTSIQAEDSGPGSSQSKYGIRPYDYAGKFISSVDQAAGFCADFLASHKDPHPIVAITYEANINATHLAAAQDLDVSDRIHIEADEHSTLYIDEDFFIEWESHSVILECGPGEVLSHLVTYRCSAAATSAWGASDGSRDSVTISVPVNVYNQDTPPTDPSPGDIWNYGGDQYSYDGVTWNALRVPDRLIVSATADGLDITFSVKAGKYSFGCDQAEFRATYVGSGAFTFPQDLRTVIEGGILANDGDENYVVTTTATMAGAHFDVTSPEDGTWFYAFRLHNAAGWSVWSDGNITPRNVQDYITVADGSTHPLPGGCAVVEDGATITLDGDMADAFVITIAGNRTLEIIGGSDCMQPLLLRVVQGSGGGRTLAMGATINVPTGGTLSPTLIATAEGDYDYLAFAYHVANDIWDFVAHPDGVYSTP